jgi:hypothetical protein
MPVVALAFLDISIRSCAGGSASAVEPGDDAMVVPIAHHGLPNPDGGAQILRCELMEGWKEALSEFM